MSNLQQRQSIIQEKRKKTPWRDFLRDIVSRYNVGMYKGSFGICELPENDRSTISLAHIYDKECAEYTNFCIEYAGGDFFKLLTDLRKVCKLPHILRRGPVENSQFAGTVGYSKNIYLSFEVFACENILYSVNTKDSCKDIINGVMIGSGSSVVYNSLGIFNSMKVFYSKSITDSHSIRFCVNVFNCEECLFCDNISYKKFCIYNEELSESEYHQKKLELLNQKHSYEARYENLGVEVANVGSEGVEGKLAIKCNNSKNIYYSYRLADSRNAVFVGTDLGNDFMYDVSSAGAPNGDHYYGVLGAGRGDHYYYSRSIEGCNNIYYSMFLINCSFCLGCVGLKNKSYCILNKQYSKEERYEKVDEIFGKMNEEGSLGEFFPPSMNPFYFNDTAAYLIDPTFTKEEVTTKGYLRRDEPIKVDIPAGVQTISVKDLGQYEGWKQLPSSGVEPRNQNYGRNEGSRNNENLDSSSLRSSEGQQWTIDDEILKKVIIDEQGNAYRIIPMELEFLRKYELPLPRKHWLDRMKENFRIN